MYNSVVFSIFPRLYNYHHYQIPEHSHHPKGNPVPLALTPILSPQVPTNLLSVPIDFPILDFLYKGNHTTCSLLGLAFLTEHNGLRVYPRLVCVRAPLLLIAWKCRV